MLTLFALASLAKGAVAYYAARKSHESLSNSSDTDKDSESTNTGVDQKSQSGESTLPIRNTVDPRCEILFDKIAFVLKDPSEDSVYTLEPLFIQLRFHYPYKEYIQNLYNSCTINSEIDIEDFAVSIIAEDFKDFLQNHNQWKSAGESILSLFNSLSPLLKKSLRGDTYLDLLASYFKDKGKGENYAEEFQNKVWSCYEDIFLDCNNKKRNVVYNGIEYQKHTTPSQIRNYQSLLGMAGRTYSKLKSLYEDEGIFEEQGCLSNELVFDIAGSIIQYTYFYFCRGLSTSRLAKDIMDSMIDYLHNGLMDREENMSDKEFVDALFNRYIGNREIHSYNYFLKMCIKICQSISVLQLGYKDDELEPNIPDGIKQEIIKNLGRFDFPFLRHIESEEKSEERTEEKNEGNTENLYKEVLKAYRDRKWELPPENQLTKNENAGNIG